MKHHSIRSGLILAATTLATGLMTSSATHAQDSVFPSKPVTVYVGYPAGSGNDFIARTVSEKLQDMWGQPVVVENRPGASGNIAAEAVAQAAPDGYSMLLAGTSHVLQAALYSNLPIDPIGQFTPVATVGQGPLVLEVGPDSTITTVEALVERGKQDPESLTFASAGNGTSLHVAGEMFKQAAGIEMLHVPYKGATPAQTDVMAGRVESMFQVMQIALPAIKNDQVRALAVTGKERVPYLPDVPTVSESGVDGFDFAIWWGFFGPAGMSGDVLEKLSSSIAEAVRSDDVADKLNGRGIIPLPGTAAGFAELVRSDDERYKSAVKAAGIAIDN